MKEQTGSAVVDGTTAASLVEAFAADVRHFLSQTPRQLPSRYLYDPLGSALFDAICQLPWYRITRAETALLAANAAAILAAASPSRIIELGAGNGSKLATLLAGMPAGGSATVHLVDVSAAALTLAAQTLARIEGLQIVTHQRPYEDGLARAQRSRSSSPALVVFLGSNIGNFDPPGAEAFLASIARTLTPGDRLLIGADLVKPESALLLAYDDPLQVTAAFNRNLLVRINRELDADFVLERFRHVAVWNAALSRIEMHLESLTAQQVHVARAGLRLSFGAGERIWTESSYKYTVDGFADLLRTCGFTQRQQWIDDEAGFLLTLAAR